MVEAISIGDPKEKNKKGELAGKQKSVTGFLIGYKPRLGKTKKNKGSNLYSFINEAKERFDVWGNASIDSSLLNDLGGLDTSLVCAGLITISFVGMRPSGKGKNDQRVCDVEIDDDKQHDQLLGKTTYKLKKPVDGKP